MRTDCTIDNRKIPCPNSTRWGGGGKGACKAGDMILYREPWEGGAHGHRLARVLGRVSAPAIGDDKTPVKGWALAMALSDDASHGYERWINPSDITLVINTPSAFAAFFFQPTLPYDAQTMRRLMAYGSMCDRFIGNAAENVAAWQADKLASAGAETGESLYGFTQRDMTDHAFAAFLRQHGALANVESVGTSNRWRDANGRVVAVAANGATLSFTAIGRNQMAVARQTIRDSFVPSLAMTPTTHKAG